MRYLLLLLFFVVGCALPNGTRHMLPVEQDITIESIERYNHWAAEHGEPECDDRCYGDVQETNVFVAHTQAEMVSITGYCGPSPAGGALPIPFDNGAPCPLGPSTQEVWGQMRKGYVFDQWVMVIVNVADWCRTFPHELIHRILARVHGNSDANHTGAIWTDLGLLDDHDESPHGPEFPPFDGCS